MCIWLWVMLGGFFCLIIGLTVKVFLIKKSLKEITAAFSRCLTTDTNILIDVSSQDRYIRRFAAAINEELKQLRRERHRFLQGNLELKHAVTGISHDLRTPLTAISGYLDLLETTGQDEEAKQYTAILKDRAEQLKQLTEELFRYSVIVSEEYTLKTERLSVNQILEESILGFYAAMQAQKIVPSIHITEKKILRDVNEDALCRIFANLINNALKYSDGDLDITLTDTGKIMFSNTAKGLTSVQAERLFDRFYTVETARKSTGLGLSISRVLTEKMNGTIYARYQNQRLCICLEFPDKLG